LKEHSLQISVTVDTSNSQLHICFSDNGIGLDEEECQSMFLPFYTKARGDKKLGLGMYQVYNLITDLYKGRIYAEPNKDRGLCVHIILPAVEEDVSF